MKTKLLSFLLLFIALNVSAQIPGNAIARFDKVFDSVCTKFKIKGASAAIIVPGIGTWKGVHGVSHNTQQISENMLFGIGSNTKTFISVLMLKLQEEGKLDLDDSIGRWIQNVQNVNEKITVRQLLNHTSGIYSYTENEQWIDSIFMDEKRVWKPNELLQFIAAPKFEPGKNWNYSNTNYLLAGMIIEKITQQPLHITLREKILLPQDLNNTFFIPEETAVPLAHPWTYVYNWREPTVDILAESDKNINAFYSSAWAAGAIMSTAEDNALFWHKLMEGRIINEVSLAEMKQFVKLSTTLGYGLGNFRYKNFNGRIVYSHGGTGFGYINENIIDSTNGIAISVLTNQDSISNSVILNQVIKALHKVTQKNQTLAVNSAAEIQPVILIYPNPSSGKIYVKIPEEIEQSATISVVNLLGQEIKLHEKNIQLSDGGKTIDLSHEKEGMYFILVRNKDIIYKQSVIIAK